MSLELQCPGEVIRSNDYQERGRKELAMSNSTKSFLMASVAALFIFGPLFYVNFTYERVPNKQTIMLIESDKIVKCDDLRYHSYMYHCVQGGKEIVIQETFKKIK